MAPSNGKPPNPSDPGTPRGGPDSDGAADRDLIRRANQRQKPAWDALHARFNGRFHVLGARLIVKHGPRIHDESRRAHLEDLVQSAWQHLIDHCSDLERGFDPAKGSLDSYLLIVARNQMFSQLRSPSRRPWTGGEDPSTAPDLATSQPDPEARVISRQALSQLQACMESELDPEDIELLRRVLVDDEDIAVIAKERDTSRNNLDKRVSRARQRLKSCMQGLGLHRSAPRKS